MLFLSDSIDTMITENRHRQNDIVIEQQFAQIDAIINSHRNRAIVNVNIENLLACWEVGQYISYQLQCADWGNKVVADLADYLKIHNPQLRGYSRRNLYNMVKFYDTYSTSAFTSLIEKLPVKEIVQLPTAQLTQIGEIVQFPTAQFNMPIPSVLTITTFTNHVEIISRCHTDEERVFYMLYAAHHRLKVEELRRCIVNQTYDSLMAKEKMMSPKLLQQHEGIEFMLKDRAIVDFLKLPARHTEHRLHKGLLEHMKEFVLEMGKDFLFMESEYPIVVGGKNRRVDLLFYHRALQCLVAVELKKDDFEPEFVGKMDMYLEALDRDVKRSYENPTIGIILCPSADRVSVEYTLSRSLSPTMVAEYRRLLIPKETMTKSLEEYCAYLKDDINKTK